MTTLDLLDCITSTRASLPTTQSIKLVMSFLLLFFIQQKKTNAAGDSIVALAGSKRN